MKHLDIPVTQEVCFQGKKCTQSLFSFDKENPKKTIFPYLFTILFTYLLAENWCPGTDRKANQAISSIMRQLYRSFVYVNRWKCVFPRLCPKSCHHLIRRGILFLYEIACAPYTPSDMINSAGKYAMLEHNLWGNCGPFFAKEGVRSVVD